MAGEGLSKCETLLLQKKRGVPFGRSALFTYTSSAQVYVKEHPPPPQGEARSGGGTGWGVGDIVDESKAYFSRLLLPPQLSLLLRKQCLSQFARAVPVSHGRGSRSAAVAVTIAGISAAACHLHTHRALKCM